MIILKTRSSQGHSDPKMVWDTMPSQEYRRYAPYSMPNLETRSEVKVKVTGIQRWYITLCHPKMHAHTKFGIPTANNIRDMLLTRIFLKNYVRGQGQGHSDPKMVRDALPSQDAFTLQIWDSYLKDCRRYAPG